MSEVTQDAWFYTLAGERLGPVAFADLQQMVEENTLDPRLDMVWKQGMDEWKPSGEIEGLFKKRAPEQRESLAPSAGSYEPPRSESVADVMAKEGEWEGVRRRGYLFFLFVFPFLWSSIFVFGAGFLQNVLGAELMKFVLPVASFVPLIFVIYVSIQRLTNLGMSRLWFFGNLVPLLNLWVGYRCFACPAGYAYTKKLDGPGIALAILYWLVVLIGALFVISAIALMFGMIDSPEIQDQLREPLRLLRERLGIS